MAEEPHDVHDFLKLSVAAIEDKYNRIQKHVVEDPGTAGDEGEESWADLLRNWLPPYYTVVTKGRIVTPSGFRSPQLDVIILKPSYPPLLVKEKLYLSAGVAAAFECKITLRSSHIFDIVETAANIRKNLPMITGTPYRELISDLKIGLLAHSHCWAGQKSKPQDNVEHALIEADNKFVDHPIQTLDLLCIANLATWYAHKSPYRGPLFGSHPEIAKERYGEDGKALSGFLCSAIGGTLQKSYYSPLGSLLTSLFMSLSWEQADMRPITSYFLSTGVGGSAFGNAREWDLSIFSDEVQADIRAQRVVREKYSEWTDMFC